MTNLILLLSSVAEHLAALAYHIDCNALLYATAAVVSRFWHEHMWMVYVAIAYTTILGLHH